MVNIFFLEKIKFKSCKSWYNLVEFASLKAILITSKKIVWLKK